MLYFWLLLLGVFTYLVVQRSVMNITRTPIWILWLVMMTPAFVLTAWSLAQGQDEPFPSGLLLGLFVVCPVIYWLLIQWGRQPKPDGQQMVATAAEDKKRTTAETRPALRPIDKEEEASLQHCFPWSVFYLQNIEYRPQAMICRGQLRSSASIAYKTVQENIESRFGNRFLVLFQEGLNGKPFFALVPNPQAKTVEKRETEPLTRPGLAIALFAITVMTTTSVGALVVAGVPEEQLQSDPALFLAGLPYALALMGILGIHELGHYLTARCYRIQATLPYFIPVPFFLGTFGAFIQLKSPVPNRKALFDVGIAGPMSGLLATLPLLIWGLSQSELVAMPEDASLLNFEALDPGTSILLALLSKLALGASLGAEQAIRLHPVAVAGCLGLVVTALNLMPIGQLDGGHIVHAMFGQRTGAVIGQVARLLVVGLALIHREFMLWAILLFFIPAVDEPALNDVSELNAQRDFWGLFALTLLVLIVIPAPEALMRFLF
ncbi:MAG: site-2 protease family protein [Leptolyngbyaceae cyanobacterium SM1_1_3]|nr:site-2 protease family protein [Leptolyngbyaceae cyanobacterium SM1_1_3]NJN01811.1 site-2 protease family protein [Leptolyngbyaceae cyanobacterium RM1_1_2]NJO10628.1 site-2 protease family protein [Leptolyngbyaceae cyanobacterium SL_1_1]